MNTQCTGIGAGTINYTPRPDCVIVAGVRTITITLTDEQIGFLESQGGTYDTAIAALIERAQGEGVADMEAVVLRLSAKLQKLEQSLLDSRTRDPEEDG